VEGAEFLGIGDGFDGVAQAVGNGAEAELEGFEDGLPTGNEGAYLAALLAEMLGESHGTGAVGLVADPIDSAEDVGPVNWIGAGENVGNEALEDTAGYIGAC
jgi:hypothetical protein